MFGWNYISVGVREFARGFKILFWGWEACVRMNPRVFWEFPTISISGLVGLSAICFYFTNIALDLVGIALGDRGHLCNICVYWRAFLGSFQTLKERLIFYFILFYFCCEAWEGSFVGKLNNLYISGSFCLAPFWTWNILYFWYVFWNWTGLQEKRSTQFQLFKVFTFYPGS